MTNYSIMRWREFSPPNRATLRLRLENEGFKLSHWIDSPHTGCGWRKLDKERVHWVISGSLKVFIKDVGSFVLNSGDRDFIPVGVYFRWEVVGEEPVMYLVGERDKPVIKKKRGRPKKKKDNDLEKLMQIFGG